MPRRDGDSITVTNLADRERFWASWRWPWPRFAGVIHWHDRPSACLRAGVKGRGAWPMERGADADESRGEGSHGPPATNGRGERI